MDRDLLGGGKPLGRESNRDPMPLIPAELDHAARVGVVHQGAGAAQTAAEFGFEPLQVQVLVEARHGGDPFASRALRGPEVDLATWL